MEEFHQILEIQLEHQNSPGGHGCPGDYDIRPFQVLLLAVERHPQDELVLQDARHQRRRGITLLNKCRRAAPILYKAGVLCLPAFWASIRSGDIFRHFVFRGHEFQLAPDDFRPNRHHFRTACRACLFLLCKGIGKHLPYSGPFELFFQRGLLLPLPGMFFYGYGVCFLHIGYGNVCPPLPRQKVSAGSGRWPGAFQRMRQKASCAGKRPPP